MADDDPKTPVENKPAENEFLDVDTSQLEEELTKTVADRVAPELTDKVSNEVAEKVTDKIIESLRGKEDDKNLSPWAKEGRAPKSYEEVADWAKIQAKQEFQAELEARDKQSQETKKTEEAETQSRIAAQNVQWDRQLEELISKKYIPDVSPEVKKKMTAGEALNEEERDDPGVQARIKLFNIMKEHGEQDMRWAYTEYYNKQPSGVRAPVFGSSKAVGNTPRSDFTYEEVHNQKLEDLLRKK